MEVDAVFLGLVAFDFLVGRLVLADGFDEAVLVEEVVGLGGEALLRLCGGGDEEGSHEQEKSFFECFHI